MTTKKTDDQPDTQEVPVTKSAKAEPKVEEGDKVTSWGDFHRNRSIDSDES